MKFGLKIRPTILHDILSVCGFLMLKELKLLRSIRTISQYLAFVKLHHTKLLIGDLKKDDFAFWGQVMLSPVFMHLSILPAAAVAGID